jgi:hypothetical protein
LNDTATAGFRRRDAGMAALILLALSIKPLLFCGGLAMP